MNTYEFGKFLAQLRKEKGLTQIQLAEKLNITDKAISRWETGKNYPDIEMFEKLSNTLDISISELLEGRRIENESLFTVSENHIVKQIKNNRKSKKKYLIIISIIVTILMFAFGYIILFENGYINGVIYNEIPCYSNDVLTIMNNIDGYISLSPQTEGDFIISFGSFYLDHNKTSDDTLYLSGTCENGRAFYINTVYNEKNPDTSCFIGEYRENQEKTEGIPFDDLKYIVSQLDLSLLPFYEKYELSIDGIANYEDYNLNYYDYQKDMIDFVYSNGVLQKYDKNLLSGKFLSITVYGCHENIGEGVAYIFYEI